MPRAAAVTLLLSAVALTTGASGAHAAGMCGPLVATPPYVTSLANGRCVSVEWGYTDPNFTGLLRARATVHGPWEDVEIFTRANLDAAAAPCLMAAPAGWTCVSAVSIAPAGSDPNATRLVMAQPYPSRADLDGYLRIAKYPKPVTQANALESFDLLRSNGRSEALALRSWYNGRFVSAELGYSGTFYGMLRARATVIGPWEEFTAVF